MLKLYNSLGRKIEEFKPVGDTVKIYSCGPTVYDNVHIGNLSSFIFADSLNRAIELADFKLKHVMNITDVDDKTIRRSQEDDNESSPEIALKELTTKYELIFKDDIKAVGVNQDRYQFIRATDSIAAIQDLIRKLIDDGFAYITDDGIYFSITEYQKSGKKYGQLIDLDIKDSSKARINNDEYDKHSVHDFALWKLRREGEPSWSFEINGKDYLGRPGWHIECSAMSTEMLGQPFDIHTGGIDLIFPHHENEIAQSTAGKISNIYSEFFAHNEHLLIENKKMSKSLGNIYTIKDLEEKGFEPIVFRLLILQSHYRSQAQFNWELMQAASYRLNDLRNFTALKYQTKDSTSKVIDFNKIKEEIKSEFLDDLNTPKVLAILSNFQSQIQEELVSDKQKDDFVSFINFIDSILGLNLNEVKDIDDSQKELLKERTKARDDNDWPKSDQLRESLIKSGVSVRDTKFGQIWYRI